MGKTERRNDFRQTLGLLFVAYIDGVWLGEEARQDVLDDLMVLLGETAVGNARHHGELLILVRQSLEELDKVVEARDSVVLTTQDDGRHAKLLWVDDGQVAAHIHIRAVRHRVL